MQSKYFTQQKFAANGAFVASTLVNWNFLTSQIEGN